MVDGINRDVVGELPVEADGGHDHQPGNNAAGKENAGDARADDVADAEIFGGDGDAERSAWKPVRASFGLGSPGLHGVHQEGVDAAETQAPENAAGERAAAFAGDEDVGAGGAFGKAEIAVLFDDELAAQRNHEEDAEPSAEQRERENSPEGEFGAEAQEDQRGDGEHDSGGERFACRAGGLHDVVFENGGAAEGAQDADGQNRDGNGSGNGETGAQTHVNGDGAEEQTEERAEDDGAEREFLDGFCRRRCTARNSPGGAVELHGRSLKESLPRAEQGTDQNGSVRDYAAGGECREENLGPGIPRKQGTAGRQVS